MTRPTGSAASREGVAYLSVLPDGRTRVLHVDDRGALLEEQDADTTEDALAWARTVAARIVRPEPERAPDPAAI